MDIFDEWRAFIGTLAQSKGSVRVPAGEIAAPPSDPLVSLLRTFLFTQSNVYGRPSHGGSRELSVTFTPTEMPISGGCGYYVAPLVDCFLSVNSSGNEERDRIFLPAGSQNVFVFGPEGWAGILRVVAVVLNGSVYISRMESPWKD
jgi:hypothetical protein